MVGVACAWIELDQDQSGWGPTRVLVATLSRDGHVAQVLIGPEPKVLIITGAQLSPALLTAIGALLPAGGSRGRCRFPIASVRRPVGRSGGGLVEGLEASANLLASGMGAGQYGQGLLVVAAAPAGLLGVPGEDAAGDLCRARTPLTAPRVHGPARIWAVHPARRRRPLGNIPRRGAVVYALLGGPRGVRLPYRGWFQRRAGPCPVLGGRARRDADDRSSAVGVAASHCERCATCGRILRRPSQFGRDDCPLGNP
jgi:hypothetical protein